MLPVVSVPPRPGAYIVPSQPLTTTTSFCACISQPAGQPAIPSQREDAAGTAGFAGAILGAHCSCMFLACKAPRMAGPDRHLLLSPNGMRPSPRPLSKHAAYHHHGAPRQASSGYITYTRPLAGLRETTPCCVCIALRFVPGRRRCK